MSNVRSQYLTSEILLLTIKEDFSISLFVYFSMHVYIPFNLFYCAALHVPDMTTENFF